METWEYQLWKEVKLSNQKNGIISCSDLVHKVKVSLSFFYIRLNYCNSGVDIASVNFDSSVIKPHQESYEGFTIETSDISDRNQ